MDCPRILTAAPDSAVISRIRIELRVKICLTVLYPRDSGQVERANGIVLQGIKTHVYDTLMAYDTHWIDELSSILWAICLCQACPTKEKPFFLIYGSEAMLPSEPWHQSTRVQKYSNEEQ